MAWSIVAMAWRIGRAEGDVDDDGYDDDNHDDDIRDDDNHNARLKSPFSSPDLKAQPRRDATCHRTEQSRASYPSPASSSTQHPPPPSSSRWTVDES